MMHDLFKNIKNNFEATRYHSLIIDRKSFPKDLDITAETKNKTIMGMIIMNHSAPLITKSFQILEWGSLIIF